ncbi:hypothetical protein RhiirC2_790407 [Rhizophagus irregularis]|uniref:Uncharacterized protein n=1 Tax=Rhizophagus irregularis TaxID=588596 RepID=A0A2N1ML96_9GLOM|nr:hypothetical protein RhiirC2_790407 [Rhizophagus irregularis]
MEILNKTSKKPRNLWISSIDAEEINDRIIYMKGFRRNKRSIWYMWEAQEVIGVNLVILKDLRKSLKNWPSGDCSSEKIRTHTKFDSKNTSGYLIARQLTEQQQETVAAMIVVGTRPREILSTGLTNDAVQFNKFNVIVDHQSQGRGVRITKVRGTNDTR